MTQSWLLCSTRMAQICQSKVSPLSFKTTRVEHLRPLFNWGSCIIIPKPGREQILDLYHKGHPGIFKMKVLACNYVWWPKIYDGIEAKVKHCNHCQLTHPSPQALLMHPWDWPEHPWLRIHLD